METGFLIENTHVTMLISLRISPPVSLKKAHVISVIHKKRKQKSYLFGILRTYKGNILILDASI